MKVLKLSVSDEGLKELVMFTKTFPALNFEVFAKDNAIVIKYDEKQLFKILSGCGKL
jgi:hypothetical protein